MPAVTRLNPPPLFDSTRNGHSQISVVEPGRTAWLSGQVALTAENMTPPDSLVDQARVVGTNLRAALDALGAAPADIAMLRAYLTDLTSERLGEAWAAIREALDDVEPSATAVGVTSLASPELQIEVEIVVRLPS